MQYVTAPNSILFVRVNAKAIKKEFVLRVAAHNYEIATSTNALYVSDLVNVTTIAQLDAYLLTLCKRYNYANFYIINNPYKALAKVAIQ
jgi:hypothetical protein